MMFHPSLNLKCKNVSGREERFVVTNHVHTLSLALSSQSSNPRLIANPYPTKTLFENTPCGIQILFKLNVA